MAKNLGENTLERLRNKKHSLEEETETLHTEMTRIEREIERLKTTLQSLEEETETLHTEMTRIKREIERLKTTLQSLFKREEEIDEEFMKNQREIAEIECHQVINSMEERYTDECRVYLLENTTWELDDQFPDYSQYDDEEKILLPYDTFNTLAKNGEFCQLDELAPDEIRAVAHYVHAHRLMQKVPNMPICGTYSAIVSECVEYNDMLYLPGTPMTDFNGDDWNFDDTTQNKSDHPHGVILVDIHNENFTIFSPEIVEYV